jgi:hypothetical protein
MSSIHCVGSAILRNLLHVCTEIADSFVRVGWVLLSLRVHQALNMHRLTDAQHPQEQRGRENLLLSNSERHPT